MRDSSAPCTSCASRKETRRNLPAREPTKRNRPSAIAWDRRGPVSFLTASRRSGQPYGERVGADVSAEGRVLRRATVDTVKLTRPPQADNSADGPSIDGGTAYEAHLFCGNSFSHVIHRNVTLPTRHRAQESSFGFSELGKRSLHHGKTQRIASPRRPNATLRRKPCVSLPRVTHRPRLCIGFPTTLECDEAYSKQGGRPSPASPYHVATPLLIFLRCRVFEYRGITARLAMRALRARRIMDGSSPGGRNARRPSPELQPGRGPNRPHARPASTQFQTIKEEQWQITSAPTPSYPNFARTAC